MLDIFYIWYNNVIVSFNQFQIAVLFEVDSKAAWPSSIDLGFLSDGESSEERMAMNKDDDDFDQIMMTVIILKERRMTWEQWGGASPKGE